MKIDLDPFVNKVLRKVAECELETGIYGRWGKGLEKRTGEPGINPYGCADAANILYTLGHFPGDPQVREKWVRALQSLQDPETGFFTESTHHRIHVTAHCIAALELFDAQPLYPVEGLRHLLAPGGIETFLDQLDWDNPWAASHQGAGCYVGLVLTGEADLAWKDRYFQWLWDECDPESGMHRRGRIQKSREPGSYFPCLAGTFHYLFNMESDHRPLRYPKALIDTCFRIRHDDPFPVDQSWGFAPVDWVYCMTRALRQSGHRYDECREELLDFTRVYLVWVLSGDFEEAHGLNDLHLLFGCLCALAELQSALPGVLITSRPLKLVLDRRPFI